jgi:MFS family permease
MEEEILAAQRQRQQSASLPAAPPPPPPPSAQSSTLKNKPRLVFLLVAFCLGELGDGLNIFQGIYLVLNGWNEGSVGAALSLMGLVSLCVTPFAGDLVDKTNIDRRFFLGMASIITGLSASAILLVHTTTSTTTSTGGAMNGADIWLIFATKTIEGLAASFIMPCLAALTLANFGPRHFDSVYAWMLTAAHLGSVAAAILAGAVAYFFYPNIKYCFLVIGASAILAIFFIQYLPQGDVLMGRGFQGKGFAMDELGQIERLDSDETTVAHDNHVKDLAPTPASYWQVFFDFKTCLLCLTGFFFQYVSFCPFVDRYRYIYLSLSCVLSMM